MLRLISLKIFENPSVYSHKPVARMQLETGRYTDTSSTDLVGLYERLIYDFPGLSTHQCSKDYPGGFLERLRVGTYLPHIIEHLCLETQAVFGYDVRYGKTRWAQEDVYDIVFAYRDKQLVKPVVDFVLSYIRSILNTNDFDFKCRLNSLSKYISLKEAGSTLRKAPFTIAIAKHGINSTVPELVGRILVDKGIKTGITSSRGIFINNEKVSGKSIALRSTLNPALATKDIDAAVFELDSQNVLAGGLPYSAADVAIITGFLDEHLGERHIETIEQLIHIKTLVVEAVNDHGISILNADDPYFTEFAKRTKSKIILFGFNKNTPVMKQHINDCGEAVFCFEDGIYFIKDTLGTKVLEFKDMPAVYVGTDSIYDIMATVCTVYACGIPIVDLRDLFLSQLRKEQYEQSLAPGTDMIYM